MTESWYSDMERLLEGLRFSSEEMVTLAAFILRDLPTLGGKVYSGPGGSGMLGRDAESTV